MSKKYPIVLVIDDSKAFRIFSKDIIKKTVKGVRIIEAQDGIEGLKMYQHHKPDLVLLDIQMPRLNGSDVLDYIIKDNRDTKIIIISAYTNDQISINQLIKHGAYNFVPKPMNRIIMMKVISDALYAGKIAGTNNQMSKSVVLNQNYN